MMIFKPFLVLLCCWLPLAVVAAAATTVVQQDSSSWLTSSGRRLPDEKQKVQEHGSTASSGRQQPERRSLQQTTTTTTTTTSDDESLYKYKASYTAEFQHVVTDSACVGGRPELRVVCTGTIRYVNASWPNSTICTTFTLSENDDDNKEDWATTARKGGYTHGLYCTINCDEPSSLKNECAQYTNTAPDWDRFARVDYECSGDVYDDIGSILLVTPASSGETTYTCPSNQRVPAQSHYARLGVTCTAGKGGAPEPGTAAADLTAAAGTADPYQEVSYNFVLFECISTAPTTDYVAALNEDTFKIGDQLFCATIDSCKIGTKCDCNTADGNEDCPLDLGDIGIVADIYNFPPACVTTADGATIPAAPPSSVESGGSNSGGSNDNNNGVVIAARFRASWSLYISDVVASTRCAVDSTVVVVECSRVGDTIALLESAASVTCSPKSSDTNNNLAALYCVDTGATSFSSNYDSFVEYECAGPVGTTSDGSRGSIPATKVRLDPTTATCQDNGGRSVRIGHGLTLAPFCSTVGFFVLDDRFVECQFGNQFHMPKVDDIYHFSCAETVLFDRSSTTTTATMDIASATIMTDQSWQNNYFTDCVRTTTRPPPTSAPSLAPAAPPTTSSAVSAPAVTPAIMPVANDIAATGRGANVGIIVGAIVGAVSFLALTGAVLFVMLCWKQEQLPPPQQQKDKQVMDVSDDRDHVGDPSETAGYHSSGRGDGDDDRLYAADEGQYMGHAIAVATAPYAAAQVMPVENTMDNIPSSGNDHGGATGKWLGSSINNGGDRSASGGGGGGGQYRNSAGNMGQQQRDVAVTYKDQVQSMLVDGRPMIAHHNIFAPRMAEERPAAAASNSRRQAYHKQDNNIVAPVTFPDYTQSMIRPGGTNAPASTATTVLLDENDHTVTMSSSGLSDTHTRRSSDPSGIYPHEEDPSSMLDPNYNSPNNNHRRRAESGSAGRLRMDL